MSKGKKKKIKEYDTRIGRLDNAIEFYQVPMLKEIREKLLASRNEIASRIGREK